MSPFPFRYRSIGKLPWLCCLAIGSLTVAAQHYRFRVLGQDEGLLNLNVRSVLQDKAGFLWLGTGNGVFRFDGVGFTRFSSKEGLPAAYTLALAESATGELWVSVQGGLARYRDGRFRAVAAPGPSMVRAMAGTATGEMILASEEGLYVASAAGEIKRMRQGGTTTVAVARDGAIWFDCGRRHFVFHWKSLLRLRSGFVMCYAYPP